MYGNLPKLCTCEVSRLKLVLRYVQQVKLKQLPPFYSETDPRLGFAELLWGSVHGENGDHVLFEFKVPENGPKVCVAQAICSTRAKAQAVAKTRQGPGISMTMIEQL